MSGKLTDDKGTVKAQSLTDRIDQVRSAFRLAVRASKPAAVIEADDVWVTEVFEDHVIAENGGAYWSVAYTEGEDGPVFAARDEWEEVEQEYVPADGKSFDPRLMLKTLGQHRVGGYLALWGSPVQRDLSREYFDAKTEGLTDIFNLVGKVPTYYHHTLDQAFGDAPRVKGIPESVGVYDVMLPDDVGLWAEIQLDMAGQYRDAIIDLVRQGKLGQSSQTLTSARKVAKDGRIERWVIAEGSVTPTPCDYRQLGRPLTELKAAYKAIGLELPDLSKPAPKGDEESRAAEQKAAELQALELAFRFIELETTE